MCPCANFVMIKQTVCYGNLSILKMAAVRHLNFHKSKFLLAGRQSGLIRFVTPNFMAIGQIVAENEIGDFVTFMMAAVRHLGFKKK